SDNNMQPSRAGYHKRHTPLSLSDREKRMTENKKAEIHPAATLYAEECKQDQLSRREFLARATALGVAAPLAYGLIGADAPAFAQETPTPGGTLRMQMDLRALKDPRISDWSEIANIMRGWMEYLVEYNNDGTIRGMLLESWE